MKSKSFNLKQTPPNKFGKSFNKTLDFIGLYKSAAETNVTPIEKKKVNEDAHKEISKPSRIGMPNRVFYSSNRKRGNNLQPVNLSQINIDGSSLPLSSPMESSSSFPNVSKVTSTPNNIRKPTNNVKSIMKNPISLDVDQNMDDSVLNISTSNNTKKRNKSVSFMLNDNEEFVPKKTKSEDFTDEAIQNKNATCKSVQLEVNEQLTKKRSAKKLKSKEITNETQPIDTPTQSVGRSHEKKKMKKTKKPKITKQGTETASSSESGTSELNLVIGQVENSKINKNKKKKHHAKGQAVQLSEGEPTSKSPKTDAESHAIEEDLENLNIGDNPHTLTQLLDDMTVVDKNKRKKLRQKFNKNKKQKVASEGSEKENSNKNEDKMKWKKKWNKDKNVPESPELSVLVENLPIQIMFSYKKLLTDHFTKFGLIKSIGVAEVYPTEESKPVFTTTINFYSDGAAKQALEEDHTSFEGSIIRVKHPLPASETTIVVKSYSLLTEQAISSTFLPAGKIRNIRYIVKGKKANYSTAFVEFDGPDAVEHAIKMANGTRIGGKKIYVSKFAMQPKKKVHSNNIENDNESDGSD